MAPRRQGGKRRGVTNCNLRRQRIADDPAQSGNGYDRFRHLSTLSFLQCFGSSSLPPLPRDVPFRSSPGPRGWHALSAAKGVVSGPTTPFVPQGVPPEFDNLFLDVPLAPLFSGPG